MGSRHFKLFFELVVGACILATLTLAGCGGGGGSTGGGTTGGGGGTTGGGGGTTGGGGGTTGGGGGTPPPSCGQLQPGGYYSVCGAASGVASVSGVPATLWLTDNYWGGSVTLTPPSAASFVMDTWLGDGGALIGSPYIVQVASAPIGQTCTVANASGVPATDVTNVFVNCTLTPYTIGGTVTGLNGTAVLQNNGGDNLTVTGAGASAVAFTFASSVTYGGAYNVKLSSLQYTNQTCTFTNNVSQAASSVSNVAMNCIPLTVTPNPPTVTAGNLAFTLTALGTGYLPNSVVTWNGATMPSSYVSPTELLAQIPASAVATAGTTAQVSVFNFGPPAVSAPAATVSIVAPSKDATAMQQNATHSGVIYVNGVTLPAAKLWSVTFTAPVSYAVTGGGLAFVTIAPVLQISGSSTNAYIYALNQSTGATVWSKTLSTTATNTAPANAAYDNGKLFVLSDAIVINGTQYPSVLTAYDGATGTQLWTTNLTSQTSYSPPTAADGYVYVMGGGSGGTLSAVDQTTGIVKWNTGVNVGGPFAPTVTADGVYAGGIGYSYGIRPATGEMIWSLMTGGSGGNSAQPVVNSTGLLYSPDLLSGATGDIYTAETGLAFVANPTYTAIVTPAIDANTGYFLQGTLGAGTLKAFSTANGAAGWSFTGDGALQSSPLVVNSNTGSYVFIGSNKNNLYAVNAATGVSITSWKLANPIPPGQNNGLTNGAMQMTGLTEGNGYLFVPNGNALTAFQLSTAP